MSEIHEAAIAGDIAGLQNLLDRGADIESRDHDEGHTPLMAGCLSPRAGPDVLGFLLDRGADPHARLRHKMVDQSHIDELIDSTDLEPELLAMLEKSREILKTPPEEIALIALAVSHGDCGKLQLLIDRGADIRHVSGHGYTLLTLAACANRMEVIDLLVAAGARSTANPTTGNQPSAGSPTTAASIKSAGSWTSGPTPRRSSGRRCTARSRSGRWRR
jgi:ankyrin repeat protein